MQRYLSLLSTGRSHIALAVSRPKRWLLRRGSTYLEVAALATRRTVPLSTVSVADSISDSIAIGDRKFSEHGELRDDHVFTFKIQKLSQKWVDLFITIALAETKVNHVEIRCSDAEDDAGVLGTSSFPAVLGLEIMQKWEKKRLFTLLGGDATTISNGNTMWNEMERMAKENPMLPPYFKLCKTPFSTQRLRAYNPQRNSRSPNE